MPNYKTRDSMITSRYTPMQLSEHTDIRKYDANGKPFEGLELGIERRLAGIDLATANNDAFFALRDAMQNPIARNALKEAFKV